MAVASILVLIVYVPLVGLGLWNVATGRPLTLGAKFAVPKWPLRQGWPTRFVGLAIVLGGGLICVYVLLNGVRWEGVVALYLVVGLSVANLILRVRKANAGRGGMAAPR